MNEIAELEVLIDQLLGILQSTVANGEVLSDEFQGIIAQELSSSLSRIEELRGQPPPYPPEEGNPADGLPPPTPPNPRIPTGETVQPLLPAPSESSNINAFRYDPRNGQLFVKFQGDYPSENGPIYKYGGVPKEIFENFARGATPPKTSGSNDWHTWEKGKMPSHGAAMYALIKQGGFPYQRVR